MALLRPLTAAAVAAAVTVAACAAETGEEDDSDTAIGAQTERIARELRIPEDVAVLAEHPDTLGALEKRGLDLGSRLVGAPLSDNRAFAASPNGQTIIKAIEADIAEAKAGDPGVGVGMRYGHRAFDVRWLASSEAKFELVSVTNRLDRRDFTPGACGEVHLLYRLAYANAITTSRLPMMLMLAYPQPKRGNDCAATARLWLDAARANGAEARAQALVAGPLAGLGRAPAPKVELNYQLVRWPSTVRPDMGGYAEYGLRVFERNGDALAPVRLDNTPREDLNADEKKALATWIGENLDAIDRGTANVPAAFLAEKTVSVSPKGLARGQNRPFALLFGKDGAGLGDVGLDALTLAKSKKALMRRLDTMTCPGCHQSQSLAGFHSLGNDRADQPAVNALADGISPHLRQQSAFRKQDALDVARGVSKLAHVPFAERARGVDGGYGSHCGLGDPGFATWTCNTGLRCSDIDGDDVGICAADGPRTSGETCEEAKVSFDANPHADKVTMGKVLTCTTPRGAGRCVRSGGNPGGFPTGMCSGPCQTVGNVEGDAICGVSVPTGFNECVGAGKPFESCIAGGAKQYRKACSATAPCGPDYVCAALLGAPPGVGACMPPYFIFQGRVDGHLVGN